MDRNRRGVPTIKRRRGDAERRRELTPVERKVKEIRTIVAPIERVTRVTDRAA